MRLRQRLEASAAGLILSFQAIPSIPKYTACACVLSHFSRVQLFATPWIVAHQAPRSMGFCRQEYWSGLPCPPPGDLPDPEIKLMCLAPPALQADSLPPGHQGCAKYTVTKNKFRVGCVPSTEGSLYGVRSISVLMNSGSLLAEQPSLHLGIPDIKDPLLCPSRAACLGMGQFRSPAPLAAEPHMADVSPRRSDRTARSDLSPCRPALWFPGMRMQCMHAKSL